MQHFKKILLIEDDEVSAYVTEHVLNEFYKTKIHWVKDGEEAIRFLTDNCQNTTINNCPTTIFLDLKMPGTNGFEFLNAISDDDNFNMTIPIIVLTTSDYPRDIELAKDYQVQGYIVKPLTTEKLATIRDEWDNNIVPSIII